MSDKSSTNLWNIRPKENSPSGLIKSPFPSKPPFSLKSLSAFGGGDAPIMSSLPPKVRNQALTISTRTVMSAHSHLNVSYLTTTRSALLDEDDRMSQSSTSTNTNNVNDFNLAQIEETIEEEKALNMEPHPKNQKFLKGGDDDDEDDELDKLGAVGGIKNGNSFKTMIAKAPERIQTKYPMKKLCFHGSLENLHGNENSPKSLNRFDAIVKSRRKSAPATLATSSVRCQMMEAANDLLHEENKCLTTKIQKTKKKLFITKIATCFALEALKRRGRIIKEMEAHIVRKEEQCAARLILHSLLLNCWRNTRRELDMKLDDNNELRKSVENFTLQVQVLRHVSNNERQKAQEKTKLIDSLSDEVRILKEENRMMRKEVEKMENELNSLQASTQNLVDENKVLAKEIKSIVEQRDSLNQSFDRERRRSEEFGRQNASIKESLEKVEKQLKETTEQRSHWQERAMTSESEAWELQLNLEDRNNSIKELKAACDTLRQEKMDLIEKKALLKTNLDKTTAALQNLSTENGELTKTFEQVKVERDTKARKIADLERTLEETKKEFLETERELLSYKLQNVRRRRDWGNALYFIVSPVDAVRRKWTDCE